MVRWALIIALFGAIALAGCGGDGDDGANGADTAPAASAPGMVSTEAEAQELVETVLLTPSDLPLGWVVANDTTEDNAAAAAQNPETASLIDRCGRLLGRTVTFEPPDTITAFLTGEALAFFSTATVYATEAGAIDCANEAATRLAQPGALARELGPLFNDPDAVVVEIASFPPVADGSFAATLTGDITAGGNTINLTLLLVGFRKGNVSAVVGSARSGSTPPADDVLPLVQLVVDRIAAAQ